MTVIDATALSGAATVFSGVSLSMEGITLRGATGRGGGIHSETDPSMTGGIVRGNTAGVSGAGVMASSGSLLLDSCLIQDNEASAFEAGACALASMTFVNATISGNRLTFD